MLDRRSSFIFSVERIAQALASRGEERDGRMPTIVCLCGSTKFGTPFQRAMLEETLAGKIVLTVGCMTQSDHELEKSGVITEEVKIRLDELHKRKIDLASEVLVLNVGGYIGSSTRSELEYAIKANKVVRFLEPPAGGTNERREAGSGSLHG